MFSCALSMNCRSVAEQVWTICACPLPPMKSMNVPRIATAQTSPAAAVMRGFIALCVGVPPHAAPSPLRGKARVPALEPNDRALHVLAGEVAPLGVREHAHPVRRIPALGGAQQVGDRQ